MAVLGKDFVVWDKAASIKFVKPITTPVKCRILLEKHLVDDVRSKLDNTSEYHLDLPLQYEDENGVVYALFTKTIYIAHKEYYKQKIKSRKNKLIT